MGKRGANYSSEEALAKRARQEGWAARSVYKLQELDRRFRLLNSGQRVLDLGAAPGSWSQYALKRVGRQGLVVSVDLKPITASLSGAVTIHDDAFALEAEQIQEATEGRAPPFDRILSDMAPDTTGVPFADHFASVELCDRALEVAGHHLVAGGHLVVKLFQGPDEQALRARLRERFKTLKSVRPKATRSQSVEIFLVAMGLRP
ncbi:MAG TPA: 50S rRNA methyltransferase [Deltaproteobacteria bacterium]|nr:50S rRNA methyltransferase [Deltaproteobacteria bacterium]HCP48070.1 50S rRNA methyltransferase [Deltaproteobacteria bacterium]